MDIMNNIALRATLLSHDGAYKRVKKTPGPGAPIPLPEFPTEFMMQQPAKNLGDGRVILSYYNPEAQSVEVLGGGGAFQGTFPMEKDEDGYWTVEVKVTPGIHVHRYRVDGVMVLNPVMPLVFAAGEPVNAFECVDETCGWYLLQDVPHGDLRMEYYHSSFTGRTKVCWVYTPAGYEESDEAYPILYLQHGAGENETGWIDMGHIDNILDNMIASGECEKMIVVMNSGWAFREEDPWTMVGGFDKELVGDCIPFIEGKYRVKRDRQYRAMAGLSMGSAQSQHIVYNHPDLFSYLGIIIGGFGTRWLGEDQRFVEDPEFLRKNLRLLFSSNGEQEETCEASRAQIQKLNEAGVSQAVFYSTPGYHDLSVCRKSIRQFLPRLFR